MADRSWLDGLFAAIDARDAERFGAYLTDDVVFRFGNAEPVHGRAAVEAAVAGFFSAVQALRHELDGAWAVDDAMACHGEVTYTRHDGSELRVPFANVLRLSGDRAREYLIFADTSALFGPA